ncbi:hypothetical protein SAMN05428945_2212 [Streptomyces sp. 2224.1]|uniref:hypothetical protein n=1 Tax=Streptomyces sp. 2224.1 TaxID=1881020 RepID=UPI000896D26A|nr:hypothetical protein [Streptomyces sp. 2224.1]SEC16776.1 hypothetical protein SAMN05428945_2212 [Streptomyces sp. 2224.1]
MIRIVTHARLAALQQDADGARKRAREIQGAADRAYAGHLRTVYDLTADMEAAERAAEAARADAAIVRELLEHTETQLATARATVTEQTARIEELSAPPSADVPMALLLYYGKPHSIHPDRSAAYAYAATLGAPPSGWVPIGERPAAELRWVCMSFIYDAARDHFRSVTAPAVEPVGGAA